MVLGVVQKSNKNDTPKFFVGLLFRYSKFRRLELLGPFYSYFEHALLILKKKLMYQTSA